MKHILLPFIAVLFILNSQSVHAQGFFTISADSFIAVPGQTLQVPVIATNFDNILGGTFSIVWNPEVLKLVNITNQIPIFSNSDFFNLQNDSFGLITTLWLELPGNNCIYNGNSVDGTIFVLNFEVVGAPGSNTDISFQAFQGILPNGVWVFNLAYVVPAQGSVYINSNLGVDPCMSVCPSSGLPAGSNYVCSMGPSGFVQVEPDTAITIFCPSNKQVISPTGACGAFVNNIDFVLYSNPDSSSVTYTLTGVTTGSGSGSASALFFNAGTTTVTYTAIFSSGEISTCTFSVHVIDNENPQFSDCPVDIVSPTDIGSCGANIFWTVPIATDNCDSLQIIASHNPGDFFPVGSTTVSYIATDPAGNQAQCSFEVIVVDQLPPQINNCPEDIELTLPAGSCSMMVFWALPTATDNCTVVLGSSGFSPGNFFPFGVTTVSYFALDLSGNQTVCSFTVTISSNSPPVLNCPGNVTVEATTGSTEIFNIGPNITSTCDSFPEVIYTMSGATFGNGFNDASGTIFQSGVTEVTYTATNLAGISSSCTFLVNVLGTAGPDLCPSDVTIPTQANECFAVVSNIAPLPDVNVVSVSYSLSGATSGSGSGSASGLEFNLGQTEVSYYFTFLSGTIDTCSFIVTVVDNQPPQFSFCTPDTSIVVATGACIVQVSWDVPIAIDNCDAAPSVVASHQPGSFFEVGTTTITYTATDASGNSATCTFTVLVTDTNPPVIICPDPVVISTGPGSCTAIINNLNPLADDNCAGFTISYQIIGSTVANGIGSASGLVFNAGQSVLTYTVTDVSGNTTFCSINVTVVDNESPYFDVCPADTVILYTLPISCLAIADWQIPVALDNCVTPTLSSNFSPGDLLQTGITNVIYEATDLQGNTGLCSFVVQVVDTISPVFTACPENIVVSSNGNNCSAIVNWNVPTAGDNCSVVTVTGNFNPGDEFPVGITEVLYTGVDASGNVSFCSFQIEVMDTVAPIILTCPIDTIFVEALIGDCGAIASWDAPTATDVCSDFSIASSHNPGDFFPTGLTSVSYSFTDVFNNVSHCTFYVQVSEITPPVINNCPISFTVFTQPGNCTATAMWIAPTAFDECGTVNLTSNFSPGSAFPIGQTAVIYTATDSAGNTTSCTFIVNVTGSQTTTVTNCPANITDFSFSSNCAAPVFWDEPQFTNNCFDIQISSSHQPGDQFSVGTTTVTYTATPQTGIPLNCTFTVTVEDNGSPQITCPGNIAFSADSVIQIENLGPLASDNCDVTSITYFTSGATILSGQNDISGSFFNEGVTFVSYIAFDAAGNSDTCTFSVTVLPDLMVIECPLDVVIASFSDTCGAFIEGLELVIVDSAGGVSAVTYEVVGSTTASGTGNVSNVFFNIGVSTVTYIVENTSGNFTNCTFTVTVTDAAPPMFTSCPEDITISGLSDSCGAFVSWTFPVTTNNCGPVSIVATHNPGDFFVVGSTQVIYIVTNAADLSDTCAFTVTIEDTTSPIFMDCPASISISSLPQSCGAFASWTPPAAMDICFTISVTSTHEPGDFFEIGSTQVVYIVTDGAGLTASCVFTVEVEDITPPVFTSCPTLITAESLPDSCGAFLSWIPPVSIDNCGGITVTSTYSPGDFFELGITEVMYIVTDGAGLSDTCIFTIEVEDNTPPLFTDCPADITLSSLSDTCGAFVNWIAPVAADNCAIAGVTSTHEPGDFFELGSTEVMYIVTDQAGFSDTCTFMVTVEDNSTLMFTDCPDALTISGLVDSCGAFVTWIPPTASGSCATASVTSTHVPGEFFELGLTEVMYIVTDGSGLSDTCIFTITVEDTTPPIFMDCPAEITISSLFDSCGAIVSWISPIAYDNCAIASVTSTHEPGDFFELGVTEVLYIVTDLAGLSDTCSFIVTVEDTTPLMFSSCPEDLAISVPFDSCSVAVSWTVPVVTNTCVAATVTSTHEPGDLFVPGLTLVTYIVTDDAGFSDTCSFTVTVTDTHPPEVSCPADTILSVESGLCGAEVAGLILMTTDNCGIDMVTYEVTGATQLSGSGQILTGFFNVGVSAVNYTVTDLSGNTSQCSFSVEVLDTEPPVLIACPENIIANVPTGACTAVINWTPPTAEDNCSVETLESTHQPGTEFSVGVTTVTYTVTDATGNTTQCSFTVTLNDNETPVITCPQNIIVSLNGTIISDPSDFIESLSIEICELTLVFDDPAVSDNCGISIFEQTQGPQSDQVFDIGLNTLVYVATDVNGNSTTCSFTIQVINELEQPVAEWLSGPVVCEGDVIELSTSFIEGAQYVWAGPDGFSSNEQNPFIVDANINNDGAYTVYYLLNGCPSSVSDSISVVVLESPQAFDVSLSVAYDQSLDMFSVTDNDFYDTRAEWTLTVSMAPQHGELTYLGNGMFSYTPLNEYYGPDSFSYTVCYDACSEVCVTAMVYIDVIREVFECEALPTIITPNGDGFNDLLEILCLESGAFPQNEIIIFNEWGGEVFRASPYMNNWGGTHNGNDLPAGTYYYVFRESPDAEVDRKYLTIYR